MSPTPPSDGSMRAAVVSELGAPLSITDLDLPEPGPGEALVKLQTRMERGQIDGRVVIDYRQ